MPFLLAGRGIVETQLTNSETFEQTLPWHDLAQRVKSNRLWIDDGVFQEYLYSPTDWHSWEPEKSANTAEILANRLYTQRAIRELVWPELRSLHQSIELLRNQLDRIERKIDQDVG